MENIARVVQHRAFIGFLVGFFSLQITPVYRFISLKLMADGTYFITYHNDSNVVLLEIQPHLTEETIKETTEQCLDLQQQNMSFNPLVIILCTGEVSPSVRSGLLPAQENPIWWTGNCAPWAEKCFIVSGEGDRHHSLDPLVVFACYFSNDEEKKREIRSMAENTIIEAIYHLLDL